MTIIWSPQAVDDVAAAVDYLVERHADDAARKLIDRVMTLVERLAAEPIEGPEHVLRTGERVRGWPSPPFRVYYQRAGDTLIVLRVYDQRQRPITK